MSEISLKKMSFEELTALEVAIRAEKDSRESELFMELIVKTCNALNAIKDSRESERFMELVIKACDALNAIKDEFPWAEMHCSEYEMNDDFNLLNLVERFSAAQFSRY